MTKTQKIWLGIFLAMFVVPEALWGPLLNALASILKLPAHSLLYNLQVFSDHPSLAYLIIWVEITGIAGLSYLNFKIRNNGRGFTKIIFTIILAILEISLLFLLYLNYAISRISFF